LFAALIVWKLTFKKSDVSVSSKKAEVEIEATVLTREFEENEEAANVDTWARSSRVSGPVNSVTEG